MKRPEIIDYDGAIGVNVAASLKEDGYKVKEESDRDGLLITISW